MTENGIYGQSGVNLYGARPDYAPDSLYGSYMSSQYAARPYDSGVAPTTPGYPSLYTGRDLLVPPFARSADPYTLDTDPFGDRTVKWGRHIGQDYQSDYVASLSVFGRTMSRDQLMQTDAGRRLLDLEEKKRKGHKRGFLDAITDFQWSDLPFIGLFASVGGSIYDAVTVSDTMKKLQNGESVSDEDLIKTRLYMAENEYRSDGSWGSTVGDIIRAAPGFMAEFFISGGTLSLARAGITKAAGTGIHLGMTRSAKILAREATQHFAEEATAKSVGKLGAKAFADLATDGTKDKIVSKVSEQLLGFMKRTSADLYKGMSDDAIREIAENRAKYEFSEMLARNAGGAMSNGYNKFGQWLKGNISRGVMDFGVWGTEESTVLFTGHTKAGRALTDAVGTFLVEAPVKGAMLMAPNQLIARPLVAAVAGQDGRVVSDAQLSLQQSALLTDNKSLMDNAEAIAFGINMLEYVSENAGRGFGSLLSAAGLGLEKVGVKGLVRPASRAVTATGGLLAEAGDEAVTLGGRMRKFVTDVFGTREQYAEKMAKDRLNIVAAKLGVTDAADRAALGTALLSNSTDALRPELRTAIGGNVAKFAEAAMDEAYRSGRRDLEYKTYARYAVAKWMYKHQVGPETVMNLYEQMGYDGILGEMFEERYSDVAKGLLGLDDRAEHDFFSNLKEAVKGLYPGWDQLTAEAVGFAMPMVTRMGIMRLQSAVGGEGKIREIRTYLEGIDDAMRHDTSVQMSYGQYLATHRLLARRDTKEISVLNGRLAEARKAKDTELEAQLSSEIETLTKVSQRRVERHQKFIGSLSEQAKENADAIITVPLLSNATLADDEKYARTPAINSDQAMQGLAGQTAIVDFAPELARRMYEAEMPLEGETDSWYRKAAHRIVGIAGALVTGDFSLAATNPAHWTARDMGLSDNVLSALKAGFKETYVATRRDAVEGRLGPRAEIARLEKEIANLESTGADAAKLEADRASLESLRESAKGAAYEASAKEVMDEAQRRFAARARQIMSANLAAHQLRSFSDGRVRDQAIAHVAATYSEEGDDRPYNYSVAEDGSVSFYKLASDGKSVDEATVVSADDFYARNKQAVDRAHDRIIAATVSLLTRGLTTSDDSRRRLLASIRMKADSELLGASIYSAAMHLIGQENLVHRVRIDGRTPLAEVMRGHSIGRTNMAVIDYIAGKASADEVDARAFESIAHSIGFRFDGTEKGLADRNAKIFRMAKLATMLRREGVEYFSKAVLDNETEDRMSANGVTTVTARRNADGVSYTATFGLKADGSPDERPFATRDELVAEMRKLGYSADAARIVFTQAKVVESEDMFHMIRELGLARQYASLFGDRGGKWIHPMLRRGSDGKYLSPERAAEVLRAEMAAAAAGRNAEKGSKERSAYERLWGENGYMAVGERLLELNGVKRNSVSKYAGEFSDYAPTLYTLSLNAGRISARSADVYVPVDPSVDEDVTSGVVNALLMHAYAFNGRLLKNELKGPVSDFLHQLDAVIETHIDAARKAKDEELVTSLLSLRRLCTADVDRVVKGDDGKLRVQRGYGLSAQSFTTIASAFCLYRDRAYADNPFLRAVADVATDARRAPAFVDFLNLVDLTLGGNGFLSEAARNAVRGEDDAGAQRGVRALMTWASGDSSAFRKAVRESLPGGMSYTRFLDLCTRRLSAMSKSGAPVISDKEKADLSDLAQAAEADVEQKRLSHFTFLGNLIGTVKGILESGKVPRQSFVEFLRDVASDAAADPNNTEEQRSAITSLLGMLQRTASADEQTAEYEAAIVRAQTAEEKRVEAEAKLADVNRRLVDLERTGRGSDTATQDELAAARAAVTGTEAERQAAVETLTSLSTPETLRRADVKGGRTGVTGTLVEEESDEDAPADSDPDLTVGSADMNLDVPEAFAAVFGAETGAFTMRKGHVLAEDEDHLLTRSQARLACNIAVRSVVATGGSVTETEVAGRLRELFPALVASETEDVLTAFRTADDLRMRAGKEWEQFAVAGAKWDFGDDTKSDEDVSSDNFNDRSLAEYNSEAVEDFLALAQRSTPETGRNLQGFLRLTKETARVMSADDASAKFLRDVLNPKLDERATTQALASAFLLNTLDAFDTPAAGEHVRGLLAKRDGQPVSRRGAFLLSYLCALPTNVRTKFGLLCANSVAATPVHLDQSTGILGNAHRKSGGKVPESLVVDGFHRLVGASPAEASDLAAKVLAAEKRLLSSGTSGGLAENARAVADEIAAVFGRESPLYSALTSEMARRQWSALPKSVRDKLAEAVTGTEVSKGSGKRIRVLSTIASALKVLASYDGTLTRADVASVFTAAFAVGDPSSAGLREAPRTAAVTDPLMTFLSSFQDALPETIMTAEIDQRRESKGSSVAVAPRDLVPMLSRWLYADESTVTTVVVDGEEKKLLSFAETCRRFFPGTSDETIRECRQDGTWPDAKRTPICAKCISTSYNTNEIYKACKAAYDDPEAECWWIPIYAGDHASSTLLQIPKDISFADVTDVSARSEQTGVDIGSPEHVREADAALREEYSDQPEVYIDAMRAAREGLSIEEATAINSQLGNVVPVFTKDEVAQIKKALGGRPMWVTSASRRTDVAFFRDRMISFLQENFKKPLTDPTRINAVEIWSKHDGLPVRDMLLACRKYKVAPIMSFSVTTLGGTAYEPGVMKADDLVGLIGQLVEDGVLNPATTTLRLDPIVPGVTSVEDVNDTLQKFYDLGVRKVVTSVMQSYGYTTGTDRDRKVVSRMNEASRKETGADYDWDKFYGVDSRGVVNFEAKPEAIAPYAAAFKEFMSSHKDMRIQSCAFGQLGLKASACLDPYILERVTGVGVFDENGKYGVENPKTRKKERKDCECYGAHSDLLKYSDRCRSACMYCYAAQDIGNPISYYNDDGTLISGKQKDAEFARARPSGAKVDYAVAVAKTPDKARAKDRAKMEMSNAFIGFGVPGSSTARYADAYGRAGLANTGDYGPKTVAFVSVNGSRGQGADGESAEQVRTYAEAIYAIARGATLVTDGFEYAASASYNVGERRLREILALLGAKSEQVKTSGGTATRWTMDAAARKRLLDDPAGTIASAAYRRVSVGDKEFAGLPVLWHSAAEMAKLGFHSFAGLKDGVIHASADIAKEKFAAKAWENPERSKAIEGFTDRVRDVGDLLQFAFLHELAHTFGRWHRGEVGTAHEDWANGWALRRMDSYREVKGVPKPERPDFAAIADPSERALAVAAFQEAMADWMEASHRGDADTVRTERVPAPNRIPAGVLGNLTGQRTAPARTGEARRPTYQANAKAACEAVGLSLMFTDTKRSAVSSLEAEGVGMIGVEETDETETVVDVDPDHDEYLFVGPSSLKALVGIPEGESRTKQINPNSKEARVANVYRDGSLVRIGGSVFRLTYEKSDDGLVKAVTYTKEREPEPKKSLRTGENRVHIIRNWKDPTGRNEAFLGSTFMRGYGAKALKRMAQDPRSSTLKAHVISTYGSDLFFAKSLSVATEPGAGEFLKGTSGRAVMDYLAKYRGSDELSTDLLTDFDSYKIGPAASKALKVRVDGREAKVMEAVFDRLYSSLVEKGVIPAKLDVSTPEGEEALAKALAKAMKAEYGSKLTGDALDALFGDLEVVDKVRGDRTARLSELLPGATVNFVEGVNGPTLDLSYREDGAMAYTVANVSHRSTVPAEPGASPRNYEVDALTMAAVLDKGGWLKGNDRLARGVWDLAANWGLVANTVYSDPAFAKSLIRSSESIQELIRNGEDPNGQNVRQELARQLWARIRRESNLPLAGIDMPLISCGASIGPNGSTVFTHATSRMQQAMMKGSELFSEEETRFYGTARRLALCNVNVNSKGFRYGWFLKRDAFDASDFMKECAALARADLGKDAQVSDGRLVALTLAKAFTRLRDDSDAARGKKADSAEAKRVADDRAAICAVFVDHHGLPVSDDKRLVQQFGFADLFVSGGSSATDDFDLSAVQCEGLDLVHNDATDEDHVFLGGTMFGLPRTPSYNGSMWLQTVRAGLPVTERQVTFTDETGAKKTAFRPGIDAMVSPDPFTNAILGCDHDGDKTKVYMLTVNKFGRTDFASPPSASTGTLSDGTEVFDAEAFISNAERPDDGTGQRDHYLNRLVAKETHRAATIGFLENCWFNEETGEEEKLPINDRRDGHYFRIPDTAKQKVSNQFVRYLFNMARCLPTGRAVENGNTFSVEPRFSEGAGSPRVKFIGGIASSPTKAFPVSDENRNLLTGEKGKKHVYQEGGNIDAPVLADDGSRGTLGDPEKGADVSTRAADAADARAMAVSMARTLHLAWATGYFREGIHKLFGNATPEQWLRFMYHVDGLSNATFDDIKEQICGRLGWTKDMMDTVVTELLVNASAGGKLPTTDLEFATALGAYSKDVKDGGAAYWMLHAANQVDDIGSAVPSAFGFGNKQKVMTAFGIESRETEDGRTVYSTKAPHDGTTVMQAVLHGLVSAKLPADVSSARFLGLVQAEVASKSMRNPVAGRLYHVMLSLGFKDGRATLTKAQAEDVVARIAKTGEAFRFAQWASKRSVLLGARSFGQSVNYLTADPGDPAAASRADRVASDYASMKEFLETEGRPTSVGGAPMASYLERMHAATRLAYDIGIGLETIAARAVGAAIRRKDVLFPAACRRAASAAENAVLARALVRDSVPQWDRLRLEGNAQQVPYVCGFFSSFGSLASRVNGTRVASAKDMYRAVDAMARGVGEMRWSGFASLEFRHGLESMFAIMYELMSTSSEFNSRNGNKAVAYLRCANDTAYGVQRVPFSRTAKAAKARKMAKDSGRPLMKLANDPLINVRPYGPAGEGLRRIIPLFRANDQESVDRIRSMFAAVIDGTSYSGSRRVQGAEGATVCKTFSLSTKSLFRYAMELAGVHGKGIGKTSGKKLQDTLDSYFGVKEVAASMKAAESKLRPENRRSDEQITEAARLSNDRYRTILDALAAAEALEEEFGKDFEMTPAMMFGQFLPFYSLMTSRTLGAPTPTSPSLLNLLPKEFYAEISAQATALDRSHHELMSVLIGTNWAPVNVEKAAIAGYAGTLAKKPDIGEVASRVWAAVEFEESASQPLGDVIDAIRSDARGGDTDVSEARTNPDYRNTFDGLSDGILGDIVDWLDGDGLLAQTPNAPQQDASSNPAPADPKVAKVAAAMGSLLGSWATVEYDGGTVFTIRGKLRGDAGHGKEVVITVDASGSGLCDTPEQVKAYANSFGYAQSLCAAVFLGTVKDPVTGEERRFSAEDFMRLPLAVREGLVRRYGIGGATLNKVAWTADGKGLATLVGAIRLSGDAGTKAYHEYFHAMMRMFEQIGLLGEADYEALVKQFGRDPTGRGKFNEERAAEAFRAWVEGNTDRATKDVRSVFRRIFDFLRGFFEALCNGFNYTGEVNDDTIFKMMVHGFAQPSDARKAELASGNAALASAMEARDAARVSGEVRKSFRLPAHDAAANEAGLVKEATDALSAELSPVRRTVSEVEDAPGFESLTDAGERSESARLEKRLARMLEADAHTPQEDLNAVLSQMAAVRQSLAYDAGQQVSGETESAPWLTVADPDVAALERLEAAGNRITATGRERTEVPPPVPGTPEAVEAETREQVTRTVFPQVEANDFYRIPDFIATALENELTERGSWRQPLESVIRKYAAPTWASATEEALDRKAVLNGLRKALVALNPGAAKRLDDKALRSSLVFEAALRMYGGLERSLVRQTGERGDTGKPMPAGDGNESAVHASMFQVSAWVVSTRPLAPAHIAQSARDRIAELYAASKSGASKAELKLHLDMMDRLLDTVGDVTKLMEFRYDQGMMAMNEIIGRLKAGTKRPTFDESGFMDDIAPIDVVDPNADLTPDNIGTRNPWSAEHLASFLMSHGDPAVQESLKLALTTAYQVAAMAKFYQELDVVPASAEDLVMRNQMLRRHRLPPNVTVAEWMASQAIGDSDLVASRGLVDHADQPYFIANNVDAWLSSLVRKSFGAKGNIGDMLMAENHEYGALKTRIADLENFYSMVFGTNVEDGGEILKVLEHTGEFRMEDGAVVRKVGGKYIKFDNYNRVTCRGVTMTESDLRVVDLYLKMCSAHASNQSSVITGVDRLHFDRSMNRDRAFYSRDAVLSRYNDGQPSTQMNALEIALVRMTKQLPSEVLDSGDGKLGLYDRFVGACLAALDAADSDAEGTDASMTGSAVYNSLVISRLVRAGLVEGMCPNGERYEPNGLRKYTRAVLKLGCDELNDLFLSSSAYAKLRANGRTAEMLDRDRVCDEFMGVYRDAARFVRQHPWLTHGDGQYFNGFGTALPFWRGSGVFMYNAVRSLRDRSEEEIRNLPRNEQTVLNLLSSENADTRLHDLPDGRYQGSIELLASRYGIEMTGRPLVDAIAAGQFESGTDLSERTGLVLPADATLADVAKAIYDSYLNEVWRIQSGEPSAKGSLREAERILEVFEASRMTRGEMFGGSTGINDEQMFRQTGTLPANYQIGHKIHVAIDGLTNAMMSRATMANLLMTPAYDGAPVYYADPSRFAADTSGLPDDFWKQIARWWSEYNSMVLGDHGYDPAKSGVQNAHDIYEALMAERSRTKGSLSYRNADGRTVRRVKYRELAKDDGDIVSVDRWLVREDDRRGEESSMLNALGGGEAMGYLKQFVQAGRTLGFGGAATRASLHRILSWSKSMSVSFSFFFPLATRWESPIGAVGAMATMASNSKLMSKWAKANPKLFAGIQKMFGGDGWITKDFLGFQDILEMMDSNDPFLAEMKSWANALGITLSTNLVNPMEPAKSVMADDIRHLKEMLRDKFGAKVAAKFGRIMDAVALRQGDKAFNYALNATKLACVAQLAMKLRYEAAKRGKAFDPVRDLRRYSGYINAEIGGIDPLRYAWAHPMNRGLMNALMFSWQWTRGAWEAGGGNVLEDLLFGGHSTTRQERDYYFGRWCRMFGGVMIGVPMLFQAAILGMSKALRAGFGLPPDDDDDKWWTFQNEDKTRWTAFDITPLLKAISALDDTKLGGMLRRIKTQGGPTAGAAGAILGSVLGAKAGGNWVTGLIGGTIGAGAGSMVPSFIPEYTGTDAANQTSRGRRYYMHFGKQGWEFFRWFDDAKGQFFSKLSMPTQRLLEGFMGRSLGYLERSLAWEDMGQFERWLAPTTDSALFNLAEAFLPFSVGGINRNADAGVLPIFGPVQMGASQTAIQKRLVKELTAWAHNDRTAYAWGVPRKSKGQTVVHDHVTDILADAKANGFDPADQLNKALGQVLTTEYGRLFRALPDDPDGDFDVREVNRIARALNRLGAKKSSVLKSIKTRFERQRRDWKTLPPEYREMISSGVQRSLADPFTEPAETTAQEKGFDY